MLRTISFWICTCLICLFFPHDLMAGTHPIALKSGMVITHSVTIRKAVYKLDAPHSMENGAIALKGDNIVVDFNGAVLQGSTDKKRPDEFYGVAIRIIKGSNIIIKNAVIRGYKIAILGRNLNHLTIEGCDLSYNFRQHLNSNREREDLSDWQSYHHNEKDEWMRFGAGIYLRDCDSMTIRDNLITGGQCGLMMTQCLHGTVYNNNFSFNSGIGIGLYSCSYNKVMNNKLDWNIRGVSYGVYYRGQDAAAILVYEQSMHNIFAYNSATHSGDGFFLWAGASTLNTGEGGCNDNLIYGNDFSFAPTNGVEITFSRNKVIRNKIFGCDNGIWGGYSYNTLIRGNDFKNNNTGIAIEQGQDNAIEGNSFNGERTGIHLWATPGRVMEGHYDDKRDVRSMRYSIKDNSFYALRTVLDISHSEGLTIRNNQVLHCSGFIRLDSSVKKILARDNDDAVKLKKENSSGAELAPEQLPDARDAMLQENDGRGKQYIMMTQWGPYDFRSPILWWTKTDSTGKMYFDILGPQGKWKLKTTEGVEKLSAETGSVPGQLTAQSKPGQSIKIELEYTGKEVVSPFGKKYGAGGIYTFSYQKPYLPVSWKLQSFSFDSTTDPVTRPAAFQKMLETTVPLRQARAQELSNTWWNGLGENLPASRIATEATGVAYFPKGQYVFGVSAGDIVRVYVDNRLVIDSWDPSKIVYDADYHHEAILALEGRHIIRVVQAQYGGYGMLYFTLRPVEAFN